MYLDSIKICEGLCLNNFIKHQYTIGNCIYQLICLVVTYALLMYNSSRTNDIKCVYNDVHELYTYIYVIYILVTNR